MMSSAQTVKKIRNNLCLDQEEFAQLLGITTSAVSNYETGRRFPRVDLIRKMIQLSNKNKLNFTLEDFFKEDKE